MQLRVIPLEGAEQSAAFEVTRPRDRGQEGFVLASLDRRQLAGGVELLQCELANGRRQTVARLQVPRVDLDESEVDELHEGI